MSYDLNVWSIGPCADAATHRGEGKGWVLNVSPSEPVMEEDIDAGVFSLLPGIGYLTVLNLEGVRTPTGETALARAAKAIATAARGIIHDPQADSATLPSGVKRWVTPPPEERVARLEMSWWMEHALLDRSALARLFAVLETHLPEAMPRRYGEYEPPAHVLAQTGRDHLLDFLVEHGAEIVMYPQAPIAGVHLHTDRRSGWLVHAGRRAFRCHQFKVTADQRALAQPGWATALMRAWRAISLELQPFYGDVRTTSGHVVSRNGRWWSDASTESHPIRAWWFAGLPPRLGHAAVFGDVYTRAWPQLAEHGEREGDLQFCSTDDWRTALDVADALGGVPAGHQLDPKGTQYPAAFPFPDT